MIADLLLQSNQLVSCAGFKIGPERMSNTCNYVRVLKEVVEERGVKVMEQQGGDKV
jgi:hypothetical protein